MESPVLAGDETASGTSAPRCRRRWCRSRSWAMPTASRSPFGQARGPEIPAQCITATMRRRARRLGLGPERFAGATGQDAAQPVDQLEGVERPCRQQDLTPVLGVTFERPRQGDVARPERQDIGEPSTRMRQHQREDMLLGLRGLVSCHSSSVG